MISNPIINAAKALCRDGPTSLVKYTYRRGVKNYLNKNQQLKVVYFASGFHYHKSKIRYDNPSHPYKKIRINPNRIKHTWKDPSPSLGLGRIKSGSWDLEQNLGLVEEEWRIEGIRERFESNISWKDTEYLEGVRKRINRKGSYDGCNTVEEYLDKRCAYIDDIYLDIKNNGYRANTGEHGHENKTSPGRHTFTQNLEPLVLIGRNGEIILNDGFHRVGIARVLDIEIPVQVLFRHKKWQLIRDKIHNLNSATSDKECAKYLNHPDIDDGN